jgi:glycosyltransferase involved in cell wall biosynthesis
MHALKPQKVALIEWSHLIEDFLDNIGVSFEDFKEKMTGGWLFGYIDALKTAGIDTVLFCFSAKVDAPLHFVHKPTGAEVCILPTTAIYRRIRKVVLNPYTQVIEEAVLYTARQKRRWYTFLLRISPYFTTPLFHLYRQIKKYKCTTIVCQDYEHARFDCCVLLGKLMRLPVFATFQGGNWQLSPYEKRIRPITLKLCKGLIVASTKESLRLIENYKLPLQKQTAIFNPIDLSMWEGESQDEARKTLGIRACRVAIWHGRIDYYRKGLDSLIDAWERVCSIADSKNFELILLGDGVNSDMLRIRLERSTATNIRWINEYTNDRKRICTYLRAADLYVFPSRNEGFPVAPLEAMACGLPVVATDVPGMVDIFPLGESSGGIILKDEDTNLLAATILELLQDKQKADKMGYMALKNVKQNFSVQVVGAQLKKFLFKDETSY